MTEQELLDQIEDIIFDTVRVMPLGIGVELHFVDTAAKAILDLVKQEEVLPLVPKH